MSIDIDAIMIYGVPYSEIPDDLTEEVDQLLDDGELDYASPYFDSPRGEWIVGVSVYCCGDKHYDLSYIIANIDNKIHHILVRDDIELLMYLSPHVT